MIQRELLVQSSVFRQVVVPDGIGGHTAIYVAETVEHHFSIAAYKTFIAEEKYV